MVLKKKVRTKKVSEPKLAKAAQLGVDPEEFDLLKSFVNEQIPQLQKRVDHLETLVTELTTPAEEEQPTADRGVSEPTP